MLDFFSPSFVANTKIIFVYNFVAPLNVKHLSCFFSNKNHDLQKKYFIENNMKKLLNYMLYI